MSKHQEQIIAAAEGKVEGELLGAAFAKPRGATTAGVGGAIPGEIGARWTGKQHEGADAAGIELGNPGAVAVTPTDLLTMAVKVTFGGRIKEVTDVLSRVPLADVDSVEVKRVGMAGVMTIAVGEGSFKLEGKPDDMRHFAAAFDRAKAAKRSASDP